MTHHVDGSLYPNLVDTDLLRHYKVDGPRLTLTTPTTQVGGIKLEFVLVWERAERPPDNALEHASGIKCNGRLRLHQFAWTTRPGSGTNTFDQVSGYSLLDR